MIRSILHQSKSVFQKQHALNKRKQTMKAVLNNIRNKSVKVAKATYSLGKHTLQNPRLTSAEKTGIIVGCAGIPLCLTMACFKRTRKYVPMTASVTGSCLRIGFSGVLRAHVDERVDIMREKVKANDEWLAEIREKTREDLFYAKAE